jgi:hypothetical protein
MFHYVDVLLQLFWNYLELFQIFWNTLDFLLSIQPTVQLVHTFMKWVVYPPQTILSKCLFDTPEINPKDN